MSIKTKLKINLARAKTVLSTIGGLALCNMALADVGADPLAASVKPQIQAMFSAGSTIAYCIYIAEVIVGSTIYIKTKNPLTFIGVPLVVGFTVAAFNYIGAQ